MNRYDVYHRMNPIQCLAVVEADSEEEAIVAHLRAKFGADVDRGHGHQLAACPSAPAAPEPRIREVFTVVGARRVLIGVAKDYADRTEIELHALPLGSRLEVR